MEASHIYGLDLEYKKCIAQPFNITVTTNYVKGASMNKNMRQFGVAHEI